MYNIIIARKRSIKKWSIKLKKIVHEISAFYLNILFKSNFYDIESKVDERNNILLWYKNLIISHLILYSLAKKL